MKRSKEKKILIIAVIFYITISVLAVLIMDLSGSVFARRGGSTPGFIKNLFNSEEPETAEEEQISPEQKLEGLENLELDEVVPEDEEAQTMEEAPGLEDMQEITEPQEEPVSEEPASEEAESPEPAPEEETAAQPSEHYYSFTSNNKDTILRMREKPDLDSAVVYELKPGSKGYVTELGDEWSKVSYAGKEGYCSNEFLAMTEITKDEYDELKTKTDEAAKKKDTTDQTDTLAANALLMAAAAQSVSDQAAPAEGGTPDQAAGQDPAAVTPDNAAEGAAQ